MVWLYKSCLYDNIMYHKVCDPLFLFHPVTLARALELKHKPSVIYSLAIETSKLFTVAGKYLIIDSYLG